MQQKSRNVCKAVDRYPHTLGFLPVCYKTPKMCDIPVEDSRNVLQSSS